MGTTQKSIILSIAGFDTSGGAGSLADIKTFESTGTYGMAVITALTLQSEKKIESIRWRNMKNIQKEIQFLMKHYHINHFKIGIVRDAEMLCEILHLLHHKNTIITWDPILQSSSSNKIFNTRTLYEVKDLIKNIYCITPNIDESIILSGKDNINEAGLYLSQYTNVIIKGGHNKTETGIDYLYLKNQNYPIKIPAQTSFNIYPKHGSGCVYSSSLISYLAQGAHLEQAAIQAKIYTEKFLSSTKTLLGYHQASIS